MRFRTSYIWAFLIALTVFGWMASGQFSGSSSGNHTANAEADTGQDSTDEAAPKQLTIKALQVANRKTALQVRASGVTRSAFDVTIINRRQGFVKAIKAKEGGWVQQGDIIIELDKSTLEADIAAARADRQAASAAYNDAKKKFSADGTLAAQLNAAEQELAAIRKTYQATEKLVARGLQTQITLSNQRAQVTAAETRLFELQSLSEEKELSASYAALKAVDARIAALEEQLGFTTITAPQTGWLEAVFVEVGEFAGDNKAVAHIIGLQELVLDVPIPQARIRDVTLGDVADVQIIGGSAETGIVTKIASTANVATRTFTIEISLDNQDGKLLSGMSAEASVTIDEVDAFKISPAHLNVNEDGQLTAKIVDADNKVAIADVELVRTSGNSAYISGLEDDMIILAAGQAFLSKGEAVRYELVTSDEERP
ncbi:MAG: efflux RND transporter periplasmic adaptor subunit [Candidatus Puniceispirillaceae bacterium]